MSEGDPYNLAGTIVDNRFRICEKVGSGGFGVVYRAEHLGFEASVALKVMRPFPVPAEQQEAFVEAFRREGKVLFKLSGIHPAIVRALEMGTLDLPDGRSTTYLAMEWLDGVALETELETRRKRQEAPMNLAEIMDVLNQPVRALDAAHQRNIVHRDIKPGNIFLHESEGEITSKLLDFGLSKAMSAANNSVDLYQKTTGNRSALTPAFAAPEQWSTALGATGPWTDVYALALLCVEAMLGRPVVEGNDPLAIVGLCLNETRRPTPRSLGIDVPNEVEEVFLTALRLEPRERYKRAGDFWSALQGVASLEFEENRITTRLVAMRPSLRPKRPITSFPPGPTELASAKTARAIPLLRNLDSTSSSPHESISQPNSFQDSDSFRLVSQSSSSTTLESAPLGGPMSPQPATPPRPFSATLRFWAAIVGATALSALASSLIAVWILSDRPSHGMPPPAVLPVPALVSAPSAIPSGPSVAPSGNPPAQSTSGLPPETMPTGSTSTAKPSGKKRETPPNPKAIQSSQPTKTPREDPLGFQH